MSIVSGIPARRPDALPRPAARGVSNLLGWTLVAGMACAVVAESELALPAVALLVAIWRFSPSGAVPPVLALALTNQWAQANSGIFYYAFVRRMTPTMAGTVDWRPFVWICNISLAMLLWGLAVGYRQMSALLRVRRQRAPEARETVISMPVLWISYLLSFGLDALIQQYAFEAGGFTQIIIAFRNLRMFVLFLLMRRAVLDGRRAMFVALVGSEVLYGITGFFAGFREALILGALAAFERFQPRKAVHWLGMGMLMAAAVVLGMLWTGIKGTLRANYSESRTEQLGNLISAAEGWFTRPWDETMSDADKFVERLWDVRIGSLAYRRVPDVVPHEQGDLLLNAVKHILMPRLFFPDKQVAAINSDAVRKYCGIWVAGSESDTSIAFGYVAEAYVDFGVPGMFLPIWLYGAAMGAGFAWLLGLYRHREIAIGACVTLFWAALFKLEICWLNMFGRLLVFVVIGATLYVFDRMLTNSEDRAASVRSRLRQLAPPPG